MMESSVSVDASVEPNRVGPDYFGFYVSEVVRLLSEGKDLHILSQASDCEMNGGVVGRKKIVNNDKQNAEDCLFSDSIGASLTEISRERLHLLLRQSVTSLSQEVDEVVDPVLSFCRLNECLKYKKSLANATAKISEIGNDDPPLKRSRLSISSADSDTKKLDVTESTRAAADGILKDSASHSATRVSKDSDTKKLDVTELTEAASNGILKDSASDSASRVSEIDDDLQFLLESDTSDFEEVMKKHADEILTTVEHMELMLEKLLHIVNSTCRPMTRSEKHSLKKLIKNLPPVNLERVAEIIQHCGPVVKTPTEMHVDLEKEDNVTLWRLYYYVKTVERAWRQCTTHH